jgi:hypothetical protein
MTQKLYYDYNNNMKALECEMMPKPPTTPYILKRKVDELFTPSFGSHNCYHSLTSSL